ncbi:hypothetical protein RFI_08138, partial [Reticulomyxa filosa]
AGNHEYYTSEYYHVGELIGKVCAKFKNVHFLQCNTIEFPDLLPNIKIAGCTLWMTLDEKLRAQALKEIDDYSMIEVQKSKEEIDHQSSEEPDAELPKADKERRYLTVEDTERFHNEHVTWLMNELDQLQSENLKRQDDEEKQKQLMILTHHPPTDYPSADTASSLLSCNHLEHLFQYPVCAWFFGHTRHNIEYIVQSASADTTSSTKQKEWNTVIASNKQGHLHPKITENYRTDKALHFLCNLLTTLAKLLPTKRLTPFLL